MIYTFNEINGRYRIEMLYGKRTQYEKIVAEKSATKKGIVLRFHNGLYVNAEKTFYMFQRGGVPRKVDTLLIYDYVTKLKNFS